MTYQVFTATPDARRRYWARSHLGWHVIAQARPNAGHRAVTSVAGRRLLDGVVTQNVDGLHTRPARTTSSSCTATSRGSSASTAATSPRAPVSTSRSARRPAAGGAGDGVNPDGDVSLPDEALDGFASCRAPRAAACSSPTSFYFGETVPAARVERTFALVPRRAAAAGPRSSLKVMSGHRFVLRASKLGIPVAIVNQGETRGDAHADLKVEAPLGEVLPRLVRRVARPRSAARHRAGRRQVAGAPGAVRASAGP
jgi:NAD-dependent SIR2 family protein deacetylase